MQIHRLPLLRRIGIPLLHRVNLGDVVIRHHWTRDRFIVHSFHHKGYWFHGRHREEEEMKTIGELVAPNDTVLDIGGHIGYTAVWLAHLASPGQCYVFEPSPFNLPYLRMNAGSKPNLSVVAEGVGQERGTLTLYVDTVGGQNSSFLEKFEGFERSQKSAHVTAKERPEVQVPITTLDQFVERASLTPSFVKIDVEGYEMEVLRGGLGTLSHSRPRLMVEVSRKNKQLAWDLMTPIGYRAFDPGRRLLRSAVELGGNTFFIHQKDNGLDR